MSVKRVVLGEGRGLLVENGNLYTVSDDPEDWGYHWKRRYARNRVRLVAEILPFKSPRPCTREA